MDPDWYVWMYRGTRERLLPNIGAMRDHAGTMGAEFRVLLFPSRFIVGPEGAGLRTMY